MPNPKKTSFQSQHDKADLISTEELIELAKKEGIDFGNGNPAERIRYFIKLGILPHAIRKLPSEVRNSKFEIRSSVTVAPATVGHLPYWCLERLKKIQKLYNRGYSYPKIAKRFKPQLPNYPTTQLPNYPFDSPIVNSRPQIVLFPKTGLSQKDLQKTLEAQTSKLTQIVREEMSGNVNIQPRASLVFTREKQASGRFKPVLLAVLGSFLLISLTTVGTYKLYQFTKEKSQLQDKSQASTNALGQVLAASSSNHKLYIDADTEVSGTTIFAEDITAPNVLYSLAAGTGVAVTGGQNPTVSLDSTEIVESVNDLAGTLTIKGSGGTSISNSGSTITISSSSSSSGLTSESDTLSSVTGRGATTTTAVTLSGGLTLGGNLSLSDTNSTFNITNAGTLAFKDSTNTLLTLVDQGSYATVRLSDKGSTGDASTCTAGDIYFNGTDATVKACTATNTWESLDAAAGIVSLTLSGDSGTDQTLSSGDTIEIAGGTNGIDTVAGATDTVTLNLDTTEIGTTTWGTATGTIWTFESGATDPTFTFASNSITIGSAATVTATDVTAFNCTDCIDFDDMEDTLDLDAALTLNQTTNTWTQNFTGTTTTGFTYNANSLTTGTAVSIASTSAAGIGGSSYLLNLSRSGANAAASHVAYGLSSSVTDTGTTSTNIAGYFTASGATNNYAAIFASGNVGVGTTTPTNLLHVQPAGSTVSTDYTTLYVNNQKNSASSVVTKFGAQILLPAAATWTGTDSTTTGIYISNASVAQENYGILIEAMSGAGGVNKYGLYLGAVSGASNNYALYTAAGNVSHVLGASDKVFIDAATTANTGTAGVLDVNATSLTHQNSGINLLYTSTAAGAAATVTQYGLYNNFTSTQAFTATSPTVNYFGDYGLTTKSGADVLTTSGTFNTYGTYADARNTSTEVTPVGTRNTYGGYFTATGAADGTTTAYGIYAAASGADTNYGLYVAAGNVNIQGLTASSGVFTDVNKNLSSTSPATLSLSGTTALNCTDCIDFDDLEDTLDLDANTNINADDNTSQFGLTITSDLSVGARTTDVLTITQANNASNNSTGNLLQLTNADAVSTAALLDLLQEAGGSTGISINLNNGGSTGISFASNVVNPTHTYISLPLRYSATGISITNDPSANDLAGTAVDIPITRITSGTLIDLGGTISSSTLGSFTGDMFKISQTRTYSGGGNTTDTGNFLDIARSNTMNNAVGAFIISGDLVTLSSNCTQTAGTCTDTSNILDINQQYASASGAVLAISNAGTGADISLDNGETIANGTNGTIIFTGVGQTNNGSIAFDLETNTIPTLVSSTDTAIGIDEDLTFIGAQAIDTTTGTLTVNPDLDITLSGAENVTITNTTASNIAGLVDIDATTTTDDVRALDVNMQYSNATAATTTGYGVYSLANINNTAGNNLISIYGIATDSSASIGSAIQAIRGSVTTSSGSAKTAWAGYFEATLGANSTDSGYGIYIGGTANTGTNLYGLYVDVGTGAGSEYAAIFNNGSVSIGDVTPDALLDIQTTASQQVWIDASVANTTTTGVVNIDVTSLTNQNSGINLLYTSTAAGAAATVTQYGLYNNFTSTQAFTATSPTVNYFGDYGLTTKSGADVLTTSGTFNTYGTYADARNTSTEVTPVGTRNTYGGYFTATGAADGTTTAYGIYAAASGADNNYAGYFSLANTGQVYLDLTLSAAARSVDALTITQANDATFNSTGNLLQLTNSDTGSTAAVIEITNAGTGADIDFNSTSPTLTLDDGGTFTIENASGTDFIAAAAATFTINLDDTTSRTERLCHGGGDTGTGVAAVSDCSGTPGDYAEDYGTTDSSIEAGDLVATDPDRQAEIVIKDGQEGSKAWVVKSSHIYQSSLLGVVSTNPNEVIGKNFDPLENPRPVALSGRVPVKVSGENGPIATGDPITSSSTPGAGMKATNAGRIVGLALQSFDDSGIGEILVFINPTYYLGTNLASNGSWPQEANSQQPDSENSLAQNSVDEYGVLVQTNNFDDQILTASQIRQLIQYEVDQKIQSLQANTQVLGASSESTSSAQTDENEATSGAQLADENSQSLSDLDALLANQDFTLSTLTLTGLSHLAQTQVAGTLSQDGTLVIDYGKQINVLGTTLFLQNDGLAGNNEDGILVDIGGGKMTIDKYGNLKIEGELASKELKTAKITIDTTSQTKPTVGTATIASGKKQVTVKTQAVEPEAKILITATGPTGGKSLYIAQKTDFESFTVALDPSLPTQSAIDFDWLIVNTNQVSQNTQ